MSEPRPDNFDIERVEVVLAGTDHHADIRRLYHDSMIEGQIRDNDTGADIDNLVAAYFEDDGQSAFWVATYDNAVIGMIGVQKIADNTAEVRRLRVRVDFRRRGVGSLLMRQALMFCQKHGYLKVVLDVRIERGPAIAMFEKFGFTLARTREIDGRKMLDFYVDLYREPHA